jgi:hypothetical protein
MTDKNKPLPACINPMPNGFEEDYDNLGDGYQGAYKPTKTTSCHTSHKPLSLGGGLFILGGSCSQPIKDQDIYVGLDMSMTTHTRAYPWIAGEAFLFSIRDMQAPSDPAQFKSLIDYLEIQIRSGKKVHVGCIGGHGRTGTVLSALVAQMMGEKDAIQYVRKNYCEKAVESAAQIEFLMKHYGVSKAEGTKDYSDYGGGKYASGKGYGQKQKPLSMSFAPMEASFCLWGPKIKQAQ